MPKSTTVISKLILRSVENYVSLFTPLGLIPFDWYPSSKRLYFTDKKWKFCVWLSGALLNFVFLIVMISFIVDYEKITGNNLGAIGRIFCLCNICFGTLCAAANLNFIASHYDNNGIHKLLSTAFEVVAAFESNEDLVAVARKRGQENKVDILGLVAMSVVPFEIILSVMISCFAAFGDSPVSWQPQYSPGRAITLVEIVNRIGAWILMFSVAMSFVAPASMYILLGIFYITGNITFTKTMSRSVHEANEEDTIKILKQFIEIKVLSRYIDDNIVIMVPTLIVVAQGLTVFSIYGTVKYMNSIVGLFYPMLAVILIVLEAAIVQQGSLMYSYSKLLLRNIQINGTNYTRRKAKGLKPLAISVGIFGFIDQAFVLTFMALIVENTVDALVFFQD